MKKSLSQLSKVLYGVGFALLFLPAFVVPSCSEFDSKSVPIDTCGVIEETDVVSADTIVEIPQQPTEGNMNSAETHTEKEHTVWAPDGVHLSFWGFLINTIRYAPVWGFVILFLCAAIMRIANKNNLTILILSIVGSFCLFFYLYIGYGVVWGFWWSLAMSLLLIAVNVGLLRQQLRENKIKENSILIK